MKKGIMVNEYMQTNQPDVGDRRCDRSIDLAHVEFNKELFMARISWQAKPCAKWIIRHSVVIYSIPEVAVVGAIPAEEKGVQIVKIPFGQFAGNHRRLSEGFIKLWMSEGRLLAVQAIGHNVSEIIQEFANMIALKTDRRWAAIIHAHPSYAEIARSAFNHALGKAVILLCSKIATISRTIGNSGIML